MKHVFLLVFSWVLFSCGIVFNNDKKVGSNTPKKIKKISLSSPLAGILHTGARAPNFQMFLGVQATDNKAYLKALSFNSDTNIITDRQYVQLGFNHQLRGLGINAIGELYAANYSNGIEKISFNVQTGFTVTPAFHVDHGEDITYEISKYHSLCFLPNGNFLAANYRPPSDLGPTYLNEYRAEGSFVNNVYTGQVLNNENFQVVTCSAISDNDIIFSTGSTNNPTGGQLLRYKRTDALSSWASTNEFDVPQFDSAQGSSQSGAWMSAVDLEHQVVYLSRFDRSTNTEFTKLIQCPIDFNQSNCLGIGDPIPGDAVVKALAPLKGTGGDLLIFTYNPNHSIYRFSPSTGSYTLVLDLNQLDLGPGVFYKQVWENPILY